MRMAPPRTNLTLVALAVMASAAVVAAAWPRRAVAAAIISVNTVVDEDVDNGACSLREAIIAANTNANYHGCLAAGAGAGDTIAFEIGSGTPAINLGATPLPTITEAVTIDGGPGRVALHGPGGPPVSGQHGLTVGSTAGGTTIRRLVVNNAADDGIFIDADDVSIVGCLIGTDATGMSAVPNQGFGIQVFGRDGVRIGGATSGGPCSGDCNVISGATNFKANVLLDLHTTNAFVRGNFIGTDVTGTAAITPQDVQGIIDKGSSNRIGGTTNTTPGGACTGDCNLISGNNINGGIVIDQAAIGSVVRGNFVGTDVTGNESISNGIAEGFSEGILSYAIGATIGGTTPEARNVVSGNKGTGIQIDGINTVVQGNYLGTNSAGTAAVPNSGPGVTVYQADSAMIGGTAPGAGNLISGASNNGATGVQILQSGNAHIVGNLIGTAADGITPLPNQFDGVWIYLESQQNTVGGPQAGSGNTIAFNGRNGVTIDNDVPAVRGNTIRGNSIYANTAAGIAFILGGNDDLAPPTIDGVNPLHGTACAPCVVEIFSDSGDEGRVFEGTVISNDGTWTFDGALSGPHVTATNTDISNNTSPFSAPFALTSPTPTPSFTPVRSQTVATPTATQTRSPTATQTRTATTETPSVTLTPPVTPTATVSTTPTPSISPMATTSATPTVVPCFGDCGGTHTVEVNDVITLVDITLGTAQPSACPHGIPDGSEANIALIIRAVNNALNGCPNATAPAQRTEQLTVGPSVWCQTPQTSLVCLLPVLDKGGQQVGQISFSVIRGAASFHTGYISFYDNSGNQTLVATNWTGTQTGGVYSGTFSGTAVNGRPFSGIVSFTTTSYTHKEGGGRVGVRTVTSYIVTGGSGALTE